MNEFFIDKVAFGINWKYVTQIHAFVPGEVWCWPLRCLKAITKTSKKTIKIKGAI